MDVVGHGLDNPTVCGLFVRLGLVPRLGVLHLT